MYKCRWQHFLLFWILLIALPVSAFSDNEGSSLLTKTILVDGIKIHYRIGGSGSPLLLIHGFTLNGSQWDPFLNDLMHNFTVIVPDLPGHGLSDPLDGSFCFQKTSKIMLGLLDHLQVKKVRCIGHSAGGITLLYMAKEQPERIEAMALVASAHRISAKGRQLLQDEKFEYLDTETKSFYRAMHPQGDKQIKRLFTQLHGIAKDNQEFVFPPKDLSAITIPTLLIWGDRDDYFPLYIAMEIYHALPNAQLWVVPGQGHTPIWKSMGGSDVAAMQFPSVVAKFISIVDKISGNSNSCQ